MPERRGPEPDKSDSTKPPEMGSVFHPEFGGAIGPEESLIDSGIEDSPDAPDSPDTPESPGSDTEPKTSPGESDTPEVEPPGDGSPERDSAQAARDQYHEIVNPLMDSPDDPSAIMNFIRNVDSAIEQLKNAELPGWAESAQATKERYLKYLEAKLKAGPEAPGDGRVEGPVFDPSSGSEAEPPAGLDVPADGELSPEPDSEVDIPAPDGTPEAEDESSGGAEGEPGSEPDGEPDAEPDSADTDTDIPPASDAEPGSEGVRDAGDALVRERFRQRSKAARMRPGSKGREKQLADEQKLEELDAAYAEEVIAQTREMLHRLKNEEGKSPEEISEAVAVFLASQELKRSEQEIKLVETNSGNRVSKFINKLRHNRKARIAINLGLASAAVLGAATGVGAVVVGAGVAKTAWRGAAGFWGGEAAHDAISGRRQGKKLRGNLDGISEAGDQDFDRVAAQVNSPEAGQVIGKEENAEAKAETIYQQRVEQLRAQIQEILESDSGDKIAVATGVLSERLDAQLKAETKQLGSDRRSVRARRLTGLAGAATAAVLVPFAAHEISGAINGHGGGGAASQPESATPHPDGSNWSSVEVHDIHNPADYGDHGIAIDHVNPGESPEEFAAKHLSKFKGWHEFNAQEQASKIKHFANQLNTQDFKDGARIRWNYDMAAGSFNFKQ